MKHLKNLIRMTKEHGLASALFFDFGMTVMKYSKNSLYHEIEDLCATKEGRNFYKRNLKVISDLFKDAVIKGEY